MKVKKQLIYIIETIENAQFPAEPLNIKYH